MFTTEEADCIVQTLSSRAYWDDNRTIFSVIATVAGDVSGKVRRETVADIVEMTHAHGAATESQLTALGALIARSTSEEITAHAQAYASLVHSGQQYKNGQPYTFHLKAVADTVPAANPLAVQVAWLHDALEDTKALREVIEMLIGEEGLKAVQAITHHPHEPRIDYYRRVKENPVALMVKLADVAHNSDPESLAQLDETTSVRLTKKYALALEVLNA